MHILMNQDIYRIMNLNWIFGIRRNSIGSKLCYKLIFYIINMLKKQKKDGYL